jgi:two-component system response regulator PilR (NtrC family)
MSKPLALVVDDESDILDLFGITLARMGVRAVTAMTVAEAKRQLERQRCDLCLTDMSLPDGTGFDLLRHLGEHYPDIPVAMITAHGNMESAVAAMKAGAFDFVAKPVDLQSLRALVESALKLRGRAPVEEGQANGGARLLGDSPAMRRIRHMIVKLARNQAPVFITGESGTGKELAARLIHAQGPRGEGPFVAVNCGAIPHDLVESELFGHKKGSFTGAVGDKDGLFQAAEGGTLFLDEVADLPLPAQVKLLRAIQEKCVRPIGAQREIPVNTRIISASHRDLGLEVEQGRFRQDLFYRINVIELRMPALRERPGDIPLLAEHLLRQIGQSVSTGAATHEPRLSAEAIEALRRHPFPGNVRELENILERAVALSEGPRIEVGDLYLPACEPPAATGLEAGAPFDGDSGSVAKRHLIEALESRHWNDAMAASKLGMSPRSLRYRLERLGLE